MSINGGNHTWGAGGDYATLGALLADIANSVVADLNLTQVGNSDDGGAAITTLFSIIIAVGKTVTFYGGIPHGGDPAVGYFNKYGSCQMRFSGAGTLIINDLYCFSLLTTGTRGANIGATDGNCSGIMNIRNCLFSSLGNAVNGFALTVISGTPPGVAGRYNIQVVNTKCWSGRDALVMFMGGGGSEEQRNIFQIENCALYLNDVSGDAPLRYRGNFLLGRPNSASYVRNTVCWTPAVGLPGFTVSAGMDITFWQGVWLNNGRSAGTDVMPWAFAALTSPPDVLELNPANPYYLEDNPSSAIATAGSAGVLPGNPYSVPFPIGIKGAYVPPVASGPTVWPWGAS